ncbi:MAG TPA: hypothetical protein EYQ00_11240 [Dehalococcoidia bacterium]|nr:hypothetical protein [Dehalococcoidia bacterium]
MKNQTDIKRARIKAQLRAQAGIDRKDFFENGGEMARWRGLRLVQKDNKKQKNKMACRRWSYAK